MVPGKPGGFAPPILFLLEKKNASRPVEEKVAWAAAFQTQFEMPFSACYGGFGLVMAGGLDHSTTYGFFNNWGYFRMHSASPLLPHIGGLG